VSRSYYRGSEGCLLVFDVLNRRSFADLHIWLDDLKQWAEEDVVIILVGNKGGLLLL
jgi:Ras-related protein Rab-2A